MNKDQLSVSLIGSGNLATNLALALQDAGVVINEIYSRNINHAAALSNKLMGSMPTSHPNLANSASSMFILAVKDDIIAHLAYELKLPLSSFVCHTSGAVGIEIIQHITVNHGVMYPLQTFTKANPIPFNNIPILIEGADIETTNVLFDLANLISDKVIFASQAERQRVHLAAVFASNFTNVMLTASQEILSTTSLELSILQPLVVQSMTNIFAKGTDTALTGPAKRGDFNTLTQHKKILLEHPEWLKVYEQLSQSIINRFGADNSSLHFHLSD